MTNRALIAHGIGVALALAAPDRTDAAEKDPPITRQQRRALERAGAFVIEAPPYENSRFERFDRQADRTHPMNPKRSR